MNLISDELTFEDKLAAREEEALERGLERGMERGREEVYYSFIKKKASKGMSPIEIISEIEDTFDISYVKAEHYVKNFLSK